MMTFSGLNLRHSEVDNPNATCFADDDVLWFEIAMDDPALVSRFDGWRECLAAATNADDKGACNVMLLEGGETASALYTVAASTECAPVCGL